ncbi:MAG: hypothetical protein QOE51_2109 [Actinoplanes sp.]|nr:hypothetical protein [Actinoplanes sp.]
MVSIDSRRRDFHRLDRFPSRVTAAGDAVASFNPVYGQGMTSAMLHASCLSEYLCNDPDLTRPARSYFADVRVIVDAAWQVSTMSDLALPHVEGPYPKGYKAIRWASGLIFKASLRDRAMSQQLDKVTAMLAHPSSSPDRDSCYGLSSHPRDDSHGTRGGCARSSAPRARGMGLRRLPQRPGDGGRGVRRRAGQAERAPGFRSLSASDRTRPGTSSRLTR